MKNGVVEGVNDQQQQQQLQQQQHTSGNHGDAPAGVSHSTLDATVQVFQPAATSGMLTSSSHQSALPNNPVGWLDHKPSETSTTKSPNMISCVLLNARSINNKLPELYNLLYGIMALL